MVTDYKEWIWLDETTRDALATIPAHRWVREWCGVAPRPTCNKWLLSAIRISATQGVLSTEHKSFVLTLLRKAGFLERQGAIPTPEQRSFANISVLCR